jgi:hypothetical protein
MNQKTPSSPGEENKPSLKSLKDEVKRLTFELEQEHRRADQLGDNCMWLIGKIDSIHFSLCPEKFGGWQARAINCVEAALLLRKPEGEKP